MEQGTPNNQEVSPDDLQSKSVQPFTPDGHTYINLPLLGTTDTLQVPLPTFLKMVRQRKDR